MKNSQSLEHDLTGLVEVWRYFESNIMDFLKQLQALPATPKRKGKKPKVREIPDLLAK